ncbi:hypothetical protein [Rhodococcus sp. SJ-2]
MNGGLSLSAPVGALVAIGWFSTLIVAPPGMASATMDGAHFGELMTLAAVRLPAGSLHSAGFSPVAQC